MLAQAAKKDALEKAKKTKAKKKAAPEKEPKIKISTEETALVKRGEPVKAQKEITAANKKERDSQEHKKRTQGKTRDNIAIEAAAMKMVDKQMPDRRSKRDQELYRQIKKNEKLILNKESLDKRIKEVQAKLGDKASVAGIITELLGLKKLSLIHI